MLIVKIGGGAAIDLESIAADLAVIKQPVVVVHGANAVRDQLAQDLGRPPKVVTSLSGYDSVLADESAMDLMMMAYSGLQNKRLVSLCRRNGVNAIGLTGLDGGLIEGVRNRGIRTRQNGKKMVLRDFSGKPVRINTSLLELLLSQGYVPIITVPIIDENGVAISTDNDEIVACLRDALKADGVVQLIEAPGLMADPSKPETMIKQMNPDDLETWEQRLGGRIKRKLLALKKLYREGRPQVVIADGRGDAPISQALAGGGTWIR